MPKNNDLENFNKNFVVPHILPFFGSITWLPNQIEEKIKKLYFRANNYAEFFNLCKVYPSVP